ncbi:MAG: hypothetical protein KAV87_63790 [Desulfobacteraceae bacterium]|nr:hypothetical protein [Desulfobacteraceae bacterium]
MPRVIEKRNISEEALFKFWREWYQKLIYRIENENIILKDKLKILKIKKKPNELLSTRDGLISSFFSHLDERTNLLEEIGGRGVGGMQIGVSIPPPMPSCVSQAALHFSIRKLWENAMSSYIYSNFRACIFQLGSLLEATLLYEITRKKILKSLDKYITLPNGKKRLPTLGVLINFCKKEGILSIENMHFAKEINQLRIEHIHLVLEKERPEDIFKVTERDELIYMDNFKGNPPVEIKNGWISADGVTIIFDANGPGIIYKYKVDAKKCYEKMKKLLNILYAHESHEGPAEG